MSNALPPVAILAGGLATRLWPITQTIPKALVTIAGKPFLEHQLGLLRQQGVSRVVLCVGHLGEMIQDAFGYGSGIEIAYSFDGPVLLGTAGAVRQALPMLGPESSSCMGIRICRWILEPFRSASPRRKSRG